MSMDEGLLRKIARTMNDGRGSSKVTFAYGTVQNGNKGLREVRIDGSENLVPVALSTDAQIDDRVLVSIDNHEAVVIGNMSTPASARTATDYMRFSDGGLTVGRLDEVGNPTGGYVFIDDHSFNILGAGGEPIAEIGSEGSVFYQDGEKIVEYTAEGTKFYKEGKRIAEFVSSGVNFYVQNNTKEYLVGSLNANNAIFNGTLYMTDSSGRTNTAIHYIPTVYDPSDGSVTAGEMHINGTGALSEGNDIYTKDLYLHGTSIFADESIYINKEADTSIKFLNSSGRYVNIGDYFAKKSDVSSGNVEVKYANDISFSGCTNNSNTTYWSTVTITSGTWIINLMVRFNTGSTTTGYRSVTLGVGSGSGSLTAFQTVTQPGFGGNEYLEATAIRTISSTRTIGFTLFQNCGTSSISGVYRIYAVRVG